VIVHQLEADIGVVELPSVSWSGVRAPRISSISVASPA
jgi:hypothetical protein